MKHCQKICWIQGVLEQLKLGVRLLLEELIISQVDSVKTILTVRLTFQD